MQTNSKSTFPVHIPIITIKSGLIFYDGCTLKCAETGARTAAALLAAVFGIKCQHGAKTKHNLIFPLNINVSFADTDEAGGEGDHLAACELTGWCPPLTDTSFDLRQAVHFHSNPAFSIPAVPCSSAAAL